MLITEHMKAMGLLDSARVMQVFSLVKFLKLTPWLVHGTSPSA